MSKSKTKRTEKKVSGTTEWAASNVNIQSGCPNDCAYCYAKSMAIRFGRETCESWKEITLKQHKLDENYKKKEGTIMFPTTHDITTENLDECLLVLHKLLGAGNKLLIVSKPDPKCIEKLCEELSEYKDQILLRFTMGSADNEVLKFWEPNAPSFEDRVSALKLAYDLGFEASVSCEPMLDNHIEAVVEKVKEYVTDAIWIGLVNRLKQIVSVNCGKFEQEADDLLELFSEERIMELYELYKDNPTIKWKESIKKIVGIEIPTQAGLDI
ncbi:MAG: hypothetical protein DRH08_15220 [Deltaproteobacteria bacterium]|nr:MAG: hypothetical protein DRH08_15220 [Deltaproteobacteria bacterium]